MSAINIKIHSVSSAVYVSVHITQRREIRVSLIHKKSGDMLAYIGDTPITKCHVRIDDQEQASLWIGRAAFDIPAGDAQRAADDLAIQLIDGRTIGGAACCRRS